MRLPRPLRPTPRANHPEKQAQKREKRDILTREVGQEGMERDLWLAPQVQARAPRL